MRLYKIDGQWLSYDDIHNEYGYTRVPTKDILTYKSTYEDLWGEMLIAVHGYYTDTTDNQRYDGEFFVSGCTGWYTINELGYRCGAMPLEAETESQEFNDGENVSRAAMLLFDPPLSQEGHPDLPQEYRYLIQDALELGWKTEEEWIDYGWHKGPVPEECYSLAVLDVETGEVVHGSSGFIGYVGGIGSYLIGDNSVGYLDGIRIYRVQENSVRCIVPLNLPAVTKIDSSVGHYSVYVDPSQSKEIYIYEDSYDTIPYDSTKLYHTNVSDGMGTWYYYEFGTTKILVNNVYVLGIINNSSIGLSAHECTTYVCDSLDAELTQVVSLSDDSVFTAFKYFKDGTTYFYVLDNTQSSWADDLSSIGYVEKEYIEMYVYSPSPYENGGVTQSSMPGGSSYAYDRNGNDAGGWSSDYYYYWDFSKRYEFGWYDNGTWIKYPQTLADMPANVETDDSFIILPSGSNLIYFGWNRSSGAPLLNKRFTCRKYHGTFSVWQNSDHTDQYPDSTGLVTDIPYDSTKGYKVLYMLTEAGAIVNITDLYKVTFSEDNGYLKITVPNGTSDRFAKFVLYTIDAPVQYETGYFNAGQGNAQMSVPYSWGPGGDNYEGIYPLDSDQGVRYDPLKVYTVKSVFYADGREITDEDTLNRSVQLMNSPFVSGGLVIRTRTNNVILGKPCGCTYEEEENPNYIEILFNLTGDGDPNTFGFNDYWGSNIISNTDLQTLEDFGVSIDSSSSPNRVSSSNSNFTFTPIGLYGASGEDLGADMSNFYCVQGRGSLGACMCIWSINDYSTYVYKWKCRITKNS